ncbi:hypothetical protein BDK51DRAFT_28087 [Blyttiomyces helicus]|uniref:Uncharacterized protein n=1 Tax=Blyttiomyces helicus TaxID=388810 RepID=A0A4P9WAD9_9FUNG|nr:hypothetical protein BDK51DRAFT_28087 [Blyttiomyces helicus]|eukprot:RKO87820.1 hypothetical protein BDK51DRAFT_28087 [Blyttiomyces helicus]
MEKSESLFCEPTPFISVFKIPDTSNVWKGLTMIMSMKDNNEEELEQLIKDGHKIDITSRTFHILRIYDILNSTNFENRKPEFVQYDMSLHVSKDKQKYTTTVLPFIRLNKVVLKPIAKENVSVKKDKIKKYREAIMEEEDAGKKDRHGMKLNNVMKEARKIAPKIDAKPLGLFPLEKIQIAGNYGQNNNRKMGKSKFSSIKDM